MKEDKWNMYETAGCFNCSDGKVKSYGGEHSGGYVSWMRCGCSQNETKRYKKWLKDPTKSKAKMRMFIDNNAGCNGGSNATNRSW